MTEDKTIRHCHTQQLKTTELKQLQGEAGVEKDLCKRLDTIRKHLSDAPVLKEFDRNVFESIVEKAIVGGDDEAGNADPSMITFVYKSGFEDKKKGDDYKPQRRNSKSEKCRHNLPTTRINSHLSLQTLYPVPVEGDTVQLAYEEGWPEKIKIIY